MWASVSHLRVEMFVFISWTDMFHQVDLHPKWDTNISTSEMSYCSLIIVVFTWDMRTHNTSVHIAMRLITSLMWNWSLWWKSGSKKSKKGRIMYNEYIDAKRGCPFSDKWLRNTKNNYALLKISVILQTFHKFIQIKSIWLVRTVNWIYLS